MVFTNRTEAGHSLAWRLEKYAGRDDVVVLGVPRGGVTVAFAAAQALHLPLDILLLRKLGVPDHEELAFGAIASGGVRVLDGLTLRELAISPSQVEAVTARERRHSAEITFPRLQKSSSNACRRSMRPRSKRCVGAARDVSGDIALVSD